MARWRDIRVGCFVGGVKAGAPGKGGRVVSTWAGPGEDRPGLATVIADGGGLVPAALQPIEGAAQIARYLTEVASQMVTLTLHERARSPASDVRRQSSHSRPGRRVLISWSCHPLPSGSLNDA